MVQMKLLFEQGNNTSWNFVRLSPGRLLPGALKETNIQRSAHYVLGTFAKWKVCVTNFKLRSYFGSAQVPIQ